MYNFGVVLSSSLSEDKKSVTYSIKLNNGGTITYATSNVIYDLYAGRAVYLDMEGSTVKTLKPLTAVSEKVLSLNASYVETANQNYLLASDVLIFKELYN